MKPKKSDERDPAQIEVEQPEIITTGFRRDQHLIREIIRQHRYRPVSRLR